MVRSPRQDLMQGFFELRTLCSRIAAPGSPALADLCALTHRLESTLQLVLEERMQRIEALVEARVNGSRDRRAPGRPGRRASDRRKTGPG